jgi:hypothetical protein
VTDLTISAERGEVPIELEGVVYPMRPSGSAQMAIEDQTGTTITELWFRMLTFFKRATGEPSDGAAGLTLKQMAVVVTECIKAAGRDRKDNDLQKFSVDRVAEIMAEAGRGAFNQPIAELLGGMITKESDEKKA